MNAQPKANSELLAEISALTQRVKDLEQSLWERKQAMVELRENEARYHSILASLEDGYFEVDLSGNLTFFTDSVCRMLAYSRAELMGMNSHQYTDEESGRKLYQEFNRIFSTGEPMRGITFDVVRKDGTKVPLELSVSLIKDVYGHPAGFRGFVRNITARRLAE